MSYLLPSLSYSYDSLEPFFDEETMKIHHTKHHQNYINNTNFILEKTAFSSLSIYELISILKEITLENKDALRNNAGGHINHILFWKTLKKDTVLPDILKIEIEKQFRDFESFKDQFEKIALNHFGSGWVWLVNQNGTLSIVSTVNQDNPLMGKYISNTYGNPIMGIDLWEHAYYLKYQNRKLEYIKSFWNVVNWNEVSSRLQK
ncbi:superoxide dismutase [Mn] [Buchnera aphidicola (Melanaphis sacchari)]|uniref:Superoxide dismutase n=1 Tax=Buchnera aphidicola (Melanaphis sacchari) TaxID=2173854 RepID=A0A2U8DFJ1_9GAMM|nr:Fe-Mn family superoxide dismutase [Buchnera aphidicola]AWH90580.1 superoxide dismutase [Mn] [Buchnera aphidicola (Melanaphis sacchari)]